MLCIFITISNLQFTPDDNTQLVRRMANVAFVTIIIPLSRVIYEIHY